MSRVRRGQKGFTLIAALLLLFLISGLAAGLVYLLNSEQRVGATDLQGNMAYYGAEAAMEKMASDLGDLYTQKKNPKTVDIQNLGLPGTPAMVPVLSGLVYPEYTFGVTDNGGYPFISKNGVLTTGANAGLSAEIIPISLAVTAQSITGAQVRMTRQVQVALIPVFQFGAFSDMDMSFFPGPKFMFAGKVHTNGNLFITSDPNAGLVFGDKVSAYKDILRVVLANGYNNTTSGGGKNGPVYIPTSANGCNSVANPGQLWDPTSSEALPAGCRNLQISPDEGSANAANAGPGAANDFPGSNPGWYKISLTTYNGMALTGLGSDDKIGTGANNLQLPFVGPGVPPVEIIRQPPAGESATSVTGSSRLYNEAQIRVLLADSAAELPGGAGDTQNVRLAYGYTDSFYCDAVSVPSAPSPYNYTYFALANNSKDIDWKGPVPSGHGNIPATKAGGTCASTGLAPNVNPGFAPTNDYALIDGYLRVEISTSPGVYVPVTQEWLALGFARGITPPTASGAFKPGTAGTNLINPSAILIFQQQKVTTWPTPITAGIIPAPTLPDATAKIVGTWPSANFRTTAPYTWLPINMYDAREGEMRNYTTNDRTCALGGIMNLVEVDVGNLNYWIQKSASGQSIDNATQNGYVLYFSDRRGTISSPFYGRKTGEYGFEGIINKGNNNAVVDPAGDQSAIGANGEEDVNGNGVLDEYGTKYLGDGFGVTAGVNESNPAYRGFAADCSITGRKNRVNGPRHALRLVDGALEDGVSRMGLPRVKAGVGGFTVASEQPVYILGDYNASSVVSGGGQIGFQDINGTHVSAAVIADAVTLLSNNWANPAAGVAGKSGGDIYSLMSPTSTSTNGTTQPGRTAAPDTWYRVAIAAGKNATFPEPGWGSGSHDTGTDGGIHNFMRYLENWGGQNSHYMGSLVTFYYSQYGVGIFKSFGEVYSPPFRDYNFDLDFQTVSKMPPGTPRFQDINNLGYRQDFTPR